MNATQYILTDGNAKRMIVRSFDASTGFYSWTTQRAEAARFNRTDALSAASQIDALIAAAGYAARPVRVVPVSGGMALER